MKKQFLIYFLLIPFMGFSQSHFKKRIVKKKNSTHYSKKRIKASPTMFKVVDGDTIPTMSLQPVTCYGKRVFKNKRQARKWTRLKYHVKKVYPYAILASARLKEYDRVLATISDDNDRKKYTKKVEKELKEEFGDELKNLTMTQGRILLKLIDRETGKTSYSIVKEMRGSFSAFMWNSLAVLFNSSMKKEYQPEEEDLAIELAIAQIEDGRF